MFKKWWQRTILLKSSCPFPTSCLKEPGVTWMNPKHYSIHITENTYIHVLASDKLLFPLLSSSLSLTFIYLRALPQGMFLIPNLAKMLRSQLCDHLYSCGKYHELIQMINRWVQKMATCQLCDPSGLQQFPNDKIPRSEYHIEKEKITSYWMSLLYYRHTVLENMNIHLRIIFFKKTISNAE